MQQNCFSGWLSFLWRFEWPNHDVCMFCQVVHSLPHDGTTKAKRISQCVSSWREKTSRVATNVYLRENIRKTKKRPVNIEKKGSGVVYTRGRYYHLMRPSQGTPTFNWVCKNMTSILFSFPFIFFLFFWGRQGCCPCSYVFSGAMRNSDLRSSLKCKSCVLNWF